MVSLLDVNLLIALFDPEAWQRYFDFETLRALEAETRDEAWSGRLREELNRFCNEGDPRILAALYEHRNATHAHELAAMAPPAAACSGERIAASTTDGLVSVPAHDEPVEM